MAHGPHEFRGGEVAAILSAAFAIFSLGAIQVWTELDAVMKERVFALGKAWMPGAEGIGPYAGKETVMLLAWVVAWVVLHLLWRRKTMDPRPWFAVALLLVLAGVLGVWPPVWHALGA